MIGAGAGVLAGVGKELYDATGRGDPSAKDLVWDGLGSTAGLLVSIGIDVLARGLASTAQGTARRDECRVHGSLLKTLRVHQP